MKISNVNIYKVEGQEKLKAFVSCLIDDCIKINNIKIIQGNERLFVSMPSKKDNNGKFQDMVFPINQETREYFENEILEKYQNSNN